MPAQIGTATAVSSSADNLRLDETLVPPSKNDVVKSDDTLVPPAKGTRGDETMVPASRNDAATMAPGASAVGNRGGSRAGGAGGYGGGVDLEPGTMLAGRYEIEKVLGTGGMGAVYRAKDRELDRQVALKVIRPELAQNAAIVDRFKQEIRLSHKVTHRNVVRMYDLSEDLGMRFVTMELVAGGDLRSLLEERGKLPTDEAADILEQICHALEAAHSEGILHRDLKPQNVMREESGRVVVMDFGLARTFEGDGMTQSGALVGTMEYMSPEQALGKELDQRSDIFALGLIGYEMLTGLMPFRAESAIASLLKRTRDKAQPLLQVDAAIPPQLSGIIGKCLEVDVEHRYKSVGEVLHDLEGWRGKTAAASLHFEADVPSTGLSGKWLFTVGGGVLAIALIAGVSLTVRHFTAAHTTTPSGTVASAPTISLAIMPFYNASGDTSLDWLGSSLAEMLGSDIGTSAEVRMVSADRMQQVLGDLHITANSQVDVATLNRVAEFTNAQTLIFGQFIKAGNTIRINTTVMGVAHDTRSVVTTDVPDQNQLLAGVDKLAGELREKLTADPKVLNDLKAHALRPTTTSVEALHDYENGVALERAGKNMDALNAFRAATAADMNFALAFSRMAETYSNLGQDDLAQSASRTAMELGETLPAGERYLIEANNAEINHNTQKAIDAYQQLAAANPSDTEVQFALAKLYEQNRDYPAAKQRLTAVLGSDPKNVAALLASGRVAIMSGDPAGGLQFLGVALPIAVDLNNQEEKAAILQATGIAYNRMNRPEDALNNLKQSLAIKEQIGDKRGAAASHEQIGSIEDLAGNQKDGLANYQQALALRKEIDDQAGIANTLIDIGSSYHDHGKPDDALKYFTQALELVRQLGDQANQALCLNNIGSIKVDQGQYQDAMTYLEQAYELRQKLNVPGDVADSQHNLAEVNTKLGQYDTALQFYLKAIDSYRALNDPVGLAQQADGMAKIFAAQGRYGAALGSMKNALDSIRQTKDMTSFTVEIVGGWGDMLAQVGRGQEGKASLDEALNDAHQIKDDAAAAMATNWLGDFYSYQGDYANARQQYSQALGIASKTADKETQLLSKVNLAKTDLALGHAAAVIPQLKKLAQDADGLGLKAVSVECSVVLAQALVATKNAAAAQQTLVLTQARAENLGLRVLDAKAQALQSALAAKAGKSSEATMENHAVVRILDGISKEDGAGKVLDRADLKAIYSAAQ
ncbi:MAG TPA: tetratricopeptide repeat protein [Acidobacteriaceae bacterium]|jgi:tetratricopeptide (TPR) repeat protein/predicted Ser/Thr protein kinase|nr:tetratricopeptide repeat protein [Acidobacteriaceae bacterium]